MSLLVNEIPVEVNLCPHEASKEREALCPLVDIERAAGHKTCGWKTLNQLCTMPD